MPNVEIIHLIDKDDAEAESNRFKKLGHVTTLNCSPPSYNTDN